MLTTVSLTMGSKGCSASLLGPEPGRYVVELDSSKLETTIRIDSAIKKASTEAFLLANKTIKFQI
ncbi:hypothetical protein GCM10023150_16550 [Kangiella taiwanensis]|uniref:Uncharacterized protein n=1 Tax=Kangiella taiwanensis TaxID=1079179 RepID=A0ABP8I3G9_9GAMM